MKPIIITLSLMLTAISSYGQFVSNTPLKHIDVEYIELIPEMRGGNRISVHIDFGQVNQMMSTKDTQLKDEDYELLEFNSMIGALNYMKKFGYSLEEVYPFVTETSSIIHYILRKEKK